MTGSVWEAKQQIRLRLIYPLEHPQKADRYGIKPGGGLLLYGPPGTGKTLLARADISAVLSSVRPSVSGKEQEKYNRWAREN